MKCIYQISSVYLEVEEIYIGSTENFKQRIERHKHNYNSGAKQKVYEFIRNNGGLSNWDIIPIEIIDFPISTEELRQYEQAYLDKYNPELNSKRAYLTDQQLKINKLKWEDNRPSRKEYKKQYYQQNKKNTSAKINCKYCDKIIAKGYLPKHVKKYCKMV